MILILAVMDCNLNEICKILSINTQDSMKQLEGLLNKKKLLLCMEMGE